MYFNLKLNQQEQHTYFTYFYLERTMLTLVKWGQQFLYWFTLGGLGIWALIGLFTISGKAERHNTERFQQIEKIEREDNQARLLAMIAAVKKNKY